MITKCSECSIRIFMRCLFNQDYEGVENFESIYTEYIDLSGIGLTQEFNLLLNIHNIQTRLNAVENHVRIHRAYFAAAGVPWEENFKDLAKYGHHLTAQGDFLRQLDMIAIREKRFVAEMNRDEKTLEVLQKKQHTVNTHDARKDFVKYKNGLGKAGYQIDKDKTDMEEYSLMIKENTDEIMQLNS